MPKDELLMSTPENKEREIRLILAKNILAVSIGSFYKNETGYQDENSGWSSTFTGNMQKIAKNRQKGLSKPKDYNEQIHWAIKEIRTIYQEKINEADKNNKEDAIKAWNRQKYIIELVLSRQISNKNQDKSKFFTEVNLNSGENIDLGDQFFFLAQNKKREELLKFSEKLWASNKISTLHQQLKKSSEKRLILGIEVHSPRNVIESTIGINSKSDHVAIRILKMVENDPQVNTGVNRIRHEFNRGKVDKSKFIQFFSQGSTGLMDAVTAKYVNSARGAAKFPSSISVSKRKILLTLIKQRNDLNDKDKDFKDFKDIIVPAETVEAIEERAQDRYDDSDAEDYTKKSADEARLALAKIKVIVKNQENLDIMLQIKGAQNLIELANGPYEELKAAIDQLEKDIEADKKAFLEALELASYLAIAIISGGSASGLLIAAIGSKLVKMGTAELLDPEKNDFFSAANIKEIGVEVAHSAISLGLDKAAKAKKIIALTTKWGEKSKIVAKNIIESTSKEFTSGAINQKLPDYDQLFFAAFSSSYSGVTSHQIELALKGKKGLINKGLEFGLKEAVSEAPVALLEPGMTFSGYIKSGAKRGAGGIGKGVKAYRDAKKHEPSETTEENKKDLEEHDENKKRTNAEDGHIIIEPDRQDSKQKDLVDILTEDTDLSWDEMVDSISNNEDLNKLRKKRDLLNYDSIGKNADTDPKASTEIDSDLDFQFKSGKDLIEADIHFSKKYGPNYQHKYKIELFVSKERLLATDQISDKEFKHSTEFQHAELARTYDLARMDKYMDSNDPNYQRIKDEIDSLPPKLKEVFSKTSKLYNSPDQKRERTHELLLESDSIKKTIEQLRKQSPKDQTKIDKELGRLSKVQIDINGLSDEGYTSKSVGSLGGKNSNPSTAIAGSLSNELAMVQKTISEFGGLGAAARDYRLYKYLYRPLDALIKSGVSLTPMQKHVYAISRDVYGSKENPQRKFYESFQPSRTDSEFEAVLQPLINGLHDLQQLARDNSRTVNKLNSKSESPVQKKLENEADSDHTKTDNHAVIPSDVQIDPESHSAKEMGALAYTQGSDIHFAPGQFKPDTKSGQELIGHELHHVKQQKEGRVQATKHEGGFKINDDQHLEKEADDAGKAYALANRPAASTKQLKQVQSGSSTKTPVTAFELTPEIQMKAKNTSNTLAPHFSIQRAKPTQQNSEIQHPFKLEKV
jgi:hypothetical protein